MTVQNVNGILRETVLEIASFSHNISLFEDHLLGLVFPPK